MRRRWTEPEFADQEPGPPLVPEGASKRDLYRLCLEHGKDPVLRELYRRHCFSLKLGTLTSLPQWDTIINLESNSPEQMVDWLEHGQRIRRLAPLVSEPEEVLEARARETRLRDVAHWQDAYSEDDGPDGVDTGDAAEGYEP